MRWMIRLRPFTGLRARMRTLTLLAVLPAVGLTLHAAIDERSRAMSVVHTNTLQYARLAAGELGHVIDGSRQILVAVTNSSDVREGGAHCSSYLMELLKGSAGHSNLAVAGPDGHIVCSAAPTGTTINVSDRSWFQRAAASGGFAAGSYELSRVNGREILVMAHAVLDQEQLRGIAYAVLDLDWLSQRAFSTELPLGAAVTLLDEMGTIVAGTPEPRRRLGQSLAQSELFQMMLSRHEGVVELADQEGVARFSAFTRLRGAPDTPFYVAVDLPISDMHALIDRSFQVRLALLLLVSVLAIAAAEVAGNKLIVRRMCDLADTARRASNGDLEARAEVIGSDEIAETARAFNAMCLELKSTIARAQEGQETLREAVDYLVEQRTREIRLMSELAKVLQACNTLDEAFEVIPGLMEPLFPGSAGAVYVLNSSRNLLEARASWGSTVVRTTFVADECWALRRGRPQWSGRRASGLRCRHADSDQADNSTCLPLVAQGDTVGLLYLWSESTHVTELDPAPELVETIADHVAIALANLRLRETLRTQSVRDPLTGLFNRRYLDETLERELHRAQRDERPLGVIMLDIDHFKTFNDSYGHNAGDAVLRQVSALFRNRIRQGDVACRYGGEEFALLLPGGPPDVVERRANELREAVKGLEVTHGGRRLPTVTISLGLAMFPTDGRDADELIRQADLALYRAKQNGRDQVMTAREHAPSVALGGPR